MLRALCLLLLLVIPADAGPPRTKPVQGPVQDPVPIIFVFEDDKGNLEFFVLYERKTRGGYNAFNARNMLHGYDIHYYDDGRWTYESGVDVPKCKP